MVAITCKQPFYDLKEEVDRMPGDTWEATKERADEIASRIPGYIEVAAATGGKPKTGKATTSRKRPASGSATAKAAAEGTADKD